MALSDDLRSEVRKILKEHWSVRDGLVVPESGDLKLGNDAIKLDATVLYADLDDSTSLVDRKRAGFAAEVYKSFLACAARVIRDSGGSITSYDGDRIMAVFIGDGKNSAAANSALKINFAVTKVINPAIVGEYPKSQYTVKHVVGIDTSNLFIARTGVRGANDLVWVGRAANYAAKLSARQGAPSQITSDVYGRLNKDAKFSHDGRPMWTPTTARELGGKRIYTSTWRRRV